eukprot:TRINITY_DN76_c0_g3_i2.p1 TRINITY_DN76_c0_g3~~TRINITY_DN76_c0_g3_i2.p1  ORF type:complete len:1461 (-),score=380.30 TRINITY_DN76_c0_g3_i2:786-5168(-)
MYMKIFSASILLILALCCKLHAAAFQLKVGVFASSNIVYYQTKKVLELASKSFFSLDSRLQFYVDVVRDPAEILEEGFQIIISSEFSDLNLNECTECFPNVAMISISIPETEFYGVVESLFEAAGWNKFGFAYCDSRVCKSESTYLTDEADQRGYEVLDMLELTLDTDIDVSVIEQSMARVWVVSGPPEHIQRLVYQILRQGLRMPQFIFSTTSCDDILKPTTYCNQSCVDFIADAIIGQICLMQPRIVDEKWMEEKWNPAVNSTSLSSVEQQETGLLDWKDDNMDLLIPIVWDSVAWLMKVIETYCDGLNGMHFDICMLNLIEPDSFIESVFATPFTGMVYANSFPDSYRLPLAVNYYSHLTEDWMSIAVLHGQHQTITPAELSLVSRWANNRNEIPPDVIISQYVPELEIKKYMHCLGFILGIITVIGAIYRKNKMKGPGLGLISKTDGIVMGLMSLVFCWMNFTAQRTFLDESWVFNINQTFCFFHVSLTAFGIPAALVYVALSIHGFKSILLNVGLHRATVLGWKTKFTLSMLAGIISTAWKWLWMEFYYRKSARDVSLIVNSYDETAFMKICTHENVYDLYGNNIQDTFPLVTYLMSCLLLAIFAAISAILIRINAHKFVLKTRRVRYLQVLIAFLSFSVTMLIIACFLEIIPRSESTQNDDSYNSTGNIGEHVTRILISSPILIMFLWADIIFIFRTKRKKDKTQKLANNKLIPDFLFEDRTKVETKEVKYKVDQCIRPPSEMRYVEENQLRTDLHTSISNMTGSAVRTTTNSRSMHRFPRTQNLSIQLGASADEMKMEAERQEQDEESIEKFMRVFEEYDATEKLDCLQKMAIRLGALRLRWVKRKKNTCQIEAKLNTVIEEFEIASVCMKRLGYQSKIRPSAAKDKCVAAGIDSVDKIIAQEQLKQRVLTLSHQLLNSDQTQNCSVVAQHGGGSSTYDLASNKLMPVPASSSSPISSHTSSGIQGSSSVSLVSSGHSPPLHGNIYHYHYHFRQQQQQQQQRAGSANGSSSDSGPIMDRSSVSVIGSAFSSSGQFGSVLVEDRRGNNHNNHHNNRYSNSRSNNNNNSINCSINTNLSSSLHEQQQQQPPPPHYHHHHHHYQNHHSIHQNEIPMPDTLIDDEEAFKECTNDVNTGVTISRDNMDFIVAGTPSHELHHQSIFTSNESINKDDDNNTNHSTTNNQKINGNIPPNCLTNINQQQQQQQHQPLYIQKQGLLPIIDQSLINSPEDVSPLDDSSVFSSLKSGHIFTPPQGPLENPSQMYKSNNNHLQHQHSVNNFLETNMNLIKNKNNMTSHSYYKHDQKSVLQLQQQQHQHPSVRHLASNGIQGTSVIIQNHGISNILVNDNNKETNRNKGHGNSQSPLFESFQDNVKFETVNHEPEESDDSTVFLPIITNNNNNNNNNIHSKEEYDSNLKLEDSNFKVISQQQQQQEQSFVPKEEHTVDSLCNRNFVS